MQNATNNGGEISLNPTLSYFKYNNTSGEQQASFNGTGKFFNTLPFFRNITGSQDDVLDKDIFGTEKVFTKPEHKLTEAYITGRFG